MIIRKAVRHVGSLRFAVVILMLLLVAMGCATILESTRGTEQALALFYRAGWFKLLLGLLGLNILASVVLRYPFHRHQVGFLLTHGGILLVLLGAVITDVFAIQGQLGITEGQGVTELRVPIDTLTVRATDAQQDWQVQLDRGLVDGFEARQTDTTAAVFDKEGLKIAVREYVPDARMFREVRDDGPAPRAAVEIMLSGGSHHHDPVWVFAGEPLAVGGHRVSLRPVHDTTFLKSDSVVPANAEPKVRLTYHGRTQDILLSAALSGTVDIGDTGSTLRVLRFLPHATVGPENELVNMSKRMVNPAIEAEVAGPEGTHKVLAFAQFPDFQSMHEGHGPTWLKVALDVPDDRAPATPLEIIIGPSGGLWARFQEGGAVRTERLELSRGVDTPWGDERLTVTRVFDHAQIHWELEPVVPVRQDRRAAVRVTLTTPDHDGEMWLMKHQPRPVTVNGRRYELAYGDLTRPLGFELQLKQFRIGYYPGSQRPRSFESHVTIVDPATGTPQDRVISMNHPTSYGGFTFYQSSYRQTAQHTVSFLSVARDPGQPIVFAGYVITLLGMVVVMWQRASARRQTAHRDRADHTSSQDGQLRSQDGRVTGRKRHVAVEV